MLNRITMNNVTLCGSLDSAPVFSHCGGSKSFYSFYLTVPRLSGVEDKINIVCSKELLSSLEVGIYPQVRVKGELRSYNNKSGVGNRLVIFVYAHDIELCEDEAQNEIVLMGTLCKKPNLRTTPLGRDICDLLVAVNRSYGHSDYLPCICWGQNALDCAIWQVGDIIELEGRIQSREYIKIIDGAQISKTAFEVSATTVEKAPKIAEQD